MSSPQDVLAYWLAELGEAGWYAGTPEIDAAIRARFAPVVEAGLAGGLTDWWRLPETLLAYLIVTDQMPRNIFRGTARAFAGDARARAAAHYGIERGWDLRIMGPERQFYYLPFEHSESLTDQERSVRLMAARLPAAPDNLLHARAHREVIRRFGRFPTRNAALGRPSTAPEADFLAAGGYGAVVKALTAA